MRWRVRPRSLDKKSALFTQDNSAAYLLAAMSGPQPRWTRSRSALASSGCHLESSSCPPLLLGNKTPLPSLSKARRDHHPCNNKPLQRWRRFVVLLRLRVVGDRHVQRSPTSLVRSPLPLFGLQHRLNRQLRVCRSPRACQPARGRQHKIACVPLLQ